LRVYDHDQQHGHGPGATREPALDHHRRERQGDRGEGAGRGRRAAAVEARGELRIHQWHASRDFGRDDARHVSDGRRRRPTLRRTHPVVHAVGPPRTALVTPPVVVAWRTLAPAAHRKPDDEDRKRERNPGFDEEPHHRLRFRLFSLVVLASIVAACTTVPQPPPPPSSSAAEPQRAVLKPVAFAELPGWTEDPAAEAWPAFLAGCTALVAPAATAVVWRDPCAAATAVDARDSASVRAFFERYFSAY